MKTLLELQDDRNDVVRASGFIVEKVEKDDDRAFTAEEQTELAGLQKDIARLDVDIAARTLKDQVSNTVKVQMKGIAADPVVSAGAPNLDGSPPDATWNVRSYGQRYGKLKAFTGPDAERKAYGSGQFLRAALFSHPGADRWCRDNGVDWRAMSIGVNTAGGFLVPEDFGTAIIDLRETYGKFRTECTTWPMTRDMQTVPRRAGGVTATATGEGAALTESDASFNQVTLTAHKIGVLTRINSELADDAIINMADWMAKEFAYAFAKWEDDAGFKGDGTPTYHSIRGATIKLNDTSLAGGYEAVATIDKFSEVTNDDLCSLMGTLPEYAHDGAKWYCSQACADVVFQRLAAAGGGNTMITLAGKLERAYLGYPIMTSASLPTSLGSLDAAVMFLFGNLGLAATLGDRREITIGLSGDRYFEYDQIGIRGTARLDINVHDIGDTTTAGPLVAYIGNVA